MTMIEYNKIHALARARKLVIQKFGNSLEHFWPMSDDGQLIRDLRGGLVCLNSAARFDKWNRAAVR